MVSIKEIEAIIKKAEETLKTAQFGFEDLSDKKRRTSGLRNLIVFGRSVTFVIQNLKTPVGEKEFSTWYLPIQESLKSDVLMKYFVTLRNEILKQGKLPISTSTRVNINPGNMSKLGNPPPGAKSFFIGDQLGGSGWVIELPDGTTENYYVELPTSMADVRQHFSELPVPEDHELKHKPIEELCENYLGKLESIIDNAREAFLGQKVQKVGKVRLPAYMRVVK
ncbi:hypothetical protein [Paraglaciecola sp. L3A3]|uniref:hypothetical protein n=1 Tax=Paraglaciecola sp. L3A3 TaxID=2686358 RepID=UPI00131BD8E3|nr:hypothetical protein [Paraglaciecola sp. L3A3]